MSEGVRRTLCAQVLFLLLLSLIQCHSFTASKVSGLIISPVQGIPRDFIAGVDASEAPWILELGGRYYDEDGVEKDILDILAESGVNWIRLRVWNDPYDEKGVPYGGGNCDLRRMTSFAAKAKARGLKVLINFHYSDWWADPSKQFKPKAWVNLTFPELVEAVYNWTYTSLSYMGENGVLPDMVQLGNEVNNGFLWPDGRAENWTQFTELLKSAIKAVREFNPSIKVMIHLSGHREVDYYISFFERLSNDNVDFDVIGLSFYTYWHGPLSKLREIIRELASRFNKTIVLAEIAYAWTLEDADGYPNIFGSGDMELRGGYKASVQGQATMIRDLIEVLVQEAGERAGGVFYWGATWIPIPGAGWKTGEGNPWENQALFDFQGKALPSLKVFKLVFEAREIVEVKPIELYDSTPINVTAYVGVKPALPSSVLAIYTDHSIRPTRVNWGEVPVYTKTGVYKLVGFLAGTTVEVHVNVVVKEPIHLVIPDPLEDDKGPGTYGYPAASVFRKGVFDIVKAVFTVIEDRVVVRVYLRDLGGNPWFGPNGFSLQYLHIYIRTTDPTITRRMYRVDTFGLGIRLREDYGWQYALLVSPGWGTEPLVHGELSVLYYSSGEVFVEDKDFQVSANVEESYIEASVPVEILKDWENLRNWKIIVAVTSWAGENPDRIRALVPGGGEWLVDATAHADEKSRIKIVAGLMADILPKAIDLLVYSGEYPEGITTGQQYEWLLGFDPDMKEEAIVPPHRLPYMVVTETITLRETVTVPHTVTFTTIQPEPFTGTPAQLVAIALLSLGVGIIVGYFVSVKKTKG